MLPYEYKNLLRGLDLGNIPFRETVPDAGHDVPVYFLPSERDDEVNVLAALEADWAFTPRAHPYPVEIFIKDGSGTLSVGAERRTYVPGDVIRIGAGVPHAFAADEDTLFVKHAYAMDARPAAAA